VLQVKPISNPGFNRDLLLQPQTSKFFSGVPVFHTPHAAGLFRSESVAPYIAGTKLFVEEGEDFELGEGEELSAKKAVAASVKKEIKGVINLSTVSSIVAGVSRFGVKDEAVKGRMCEDSFKLLKEDGKQLGWSCFALHDSFGTASMTHNLAPSDVIRRYVGLGENWEGNVGAKMMTSGAHTSMCHDELYVNTATVYSHRDTYSAPRPAKHKSSHTQEDENRKNSLVSVKSLTVCNHLLDKPQFALVCRKVSMLLAFGNHLKKHAGVESAKLFGLSSTMQRASGDGQGLFGILHHCDSTLLEMYPLLKRSDICSFVIRYQSQLVRITKKALAMNTVRESLIGLVYEFDESLGVLKLWD
ncbi:hypothetical protein HDU99_008363, partial [Rhizoclosmatium hyalinum]